MDKILHKQCNKIADRNAKKYRTGSENEQESGQEVVE